MLSQNRASPPSHDGGPTRRASYPFRIAVLVFFTGIVQVLPIQPTHSQCQRQAHEVQGGKGEVAHGSAEEAHDARHNPVLDL
jgi:hypothetical protein